MTGERIGIALQGTRGSFELAVDFAAPMRGITALFGPSGCGKTSVLRCVAGLEWLRGRVAIGDEVWQDQNRFVPTHRRALGYVFQEASLFAHLSVRANLLYGARRTGQAEQRIRFDDVVSLLGLERLMERSPDNLSGGERQRVSIGRALLSQPRLLLMDEPLSALDRIARDEILPYFEALHAGLDIPILYVTHDLAEVERLADHLVLMREGRVVASGPLNETLTAENSPLALRRDLASILSARILRVEADGIAVLEIGGTELLVIADRRFRPGEPVRVRIAASDVSIARQRAEATSILNSVLATIAGMEPLGEAEVNLRLAFAGREDASFIARISRRSRDNLALRVGDSVVAQIKGVSLLASR